MARCRPDDHAGPTSVVYRIAVLKPAVPRQLETYCFEQIRHAILTGELAPGEALVESRLAEQFGISKTPVREALIRLSADGLVEIAPYRGARVIEIDPSAISDIIELRVLLELPIIAKLAEAHPEQVITDLERSIDVSRAALADDRRDDYLEAIWAFSSIIYGTCNNPRMVQVLSGLADQFHLIGATALRSQGRDRRSIDEHTAILTALRAGDVDQSVRAARLHIESILADLPR